MYVGILVDNAHSDFDIVIALFFFWFHIGPKEEVHLPQETSSEVNEGM